MFGKCFHLHNINFLGVTVCCNFSVILCAIYCSIVFLPVVNLKIVHSSSLPTKSSLRHNRSAAGHWAPRPRALKQALPATYDWPYHNSTFEGLKIELPNDYPPGNDHISHPKVLLKIFFLFPRWDMLIPWRVRLPKEKPLSETEKIIFCFHFQLPGLQVQRYEFHD